MINSAFGLDGIEAKVGQVIRTNESRLQNTLSKGSTNTENLLEMQMNLNKWSLSVQVQSSIVKELSDALKGILQKSA
ncbi:EscF/YscF/HrpA family type III secretion system needle major subunit [Limnobacter alexandrii]|jgi:type III secretion protein F|uniref:EscF/YscF/HrpA family type III secretion system needle major subunit n=1 Tax=Limnobacter alexandrii TaxID=2570352 RepID=UPI0011097646|nr:EscF/YscF/HrpA family type III secretion system needle major subunit [Limnobacter alexandrii]